MSYTVSYAAVCFQGYVRMNNEDNFCLTGQCLPERNHGLDTVRIGQFDNRASEAVAVFDGMGGEAAGETASFLAADYFRQCSRPKSSGFYEWSVKRHLHEACDEMNRRVCDYARQHGVGTMGTTFAAVFFGDSHLFCVNLGDSRIYRLRKGEILQISEDHTSGYGLTRKAPLTQFLGIPSNEIRLQPAVSRHAYRAGDRYLLCSDGLTDMLSDEKILALTDSTSIETGIGALRDAVLKAGAIDNTTIIFCEIGKGGLP